MSGSTSYQTLRPRAAGEGVSTAQATKAPTEVWKGLARQLNQVQCGQGTRTDCYLNCQTIGAVGSITKLMEEVGKSIGQLEGIAGGLSQAQEVC